MCLAQHFGGEIVNCDSLQLYRGFDIGTAKTPPGERRGVRHHLFDVLTPQQSYSAGEYAREARKVSCGNRWARTVAASGWWHRFLPARIA